MAPIDDFYNQITTLANQFNTHVLPANINPLTVRTDHIQLSTKHYQQVWDMFTPANRFLFQGNVTPDLQSGIIGLLHHVPTVYGPINMFQMVELAEHAPRDSGFDYIEVRPMDLSQFDNMVANFQAYFPGLVKTILPYVYWEVALFPGFKLRLAGESVFGRVKFNVMT